MRATFFLLAFFVGSSARATIELAIPLLKAEWRPAIQNKENEELLSRTAAAIDTALETLSSHRPSTSNIFQWDAAKKAQLERKDIRLFVTTSSDPDLAPILAITGNSFRSEVFSFRMLAEGATHIAVYILADNIYFDARDDLRDDFQERLTVGLAREFFGNAQRFLETSFKRRRDEFEAADAWELKTTQAVLDFIDRVLDGPDLEKRFRRRYERFHKMEALKLKKLRFESGEDVLMRPTRSA